MALKMSRISDDELYEQMTRGQVEERIAHLTSEGDGSERRTIVATPQAMEEDREPEPVIYQNIQEIIPGLFIGDYTAAIDGKLLKSKDISFVVAAMRQRYPAPSGVKIHRILIDDTSKTNILRYFPESNGLIRKARSEGKNVLVHCQAGVSRSTTLCAAFLMEELDLTAEEAIDKIASVRSVVSPIEFFLHQLEIFERCNFDLNPSKYPEYRRFLMNYNAQDMLDGDGVDELILAYYPSPAPSPHRSPGLPDPFLSMTPMNGSGPAMPPRSRRGSSNSISSQEARSEILARVRRGSVGAAASLGMTAMTNNRRLSDGQHVGSGGLAPLTRRKSSRTKSTGERDEELTKLRALLEEKRRKEAEEIAGKKPADTGDLDRKAQTSYTATTPGHTKERKLRCKMCRRDLAAREHVLEHEPGQGQRAFAPNRRDMTQHRMDTEKRRLEKAKEREAKQLERQRLAAEAAEDILLEAEDAVASASGSEDEDETNTAAPAQQDTQSVPSASVPQIRQPPPQPDAQQRPPVQRPGASPAKPNSLASRLPPQLAALRVAMPNRPALAMSDSVDGSAIDDDDAETPATEGPPSPKLLPSSVCTSYFTEPLSWMQPQLEGGELNGKILCPNTKCGAKLGNFDWSGLQCSCAAWVCPGFALAASKVDEVKI